MRRCLRTSQADTRFHRGLRSSVASDTLTGLVTSLGLERASEPISDDQVSPQQHAYHPKYDAINTEAKCAAALSADGEAGEEDEEEFVGAEEAVWPLLKAPLLFTSSPESTSVFSVPKAPSQNSAMTAPPSPLDRTCTALR